jgi:Tfp pilus assembly protein PilE
MIRGFHQRGFTLVELMVGVLNGTIRLATTVAEPADIGE